MRFIASFNCGRLQQFAVFALNEPELWNYSLVSVAGENFTKYIDSALAARVAGKEYPFIVFDKRTGEYAEQYAFLRYPVLQKTVQLGYTWYGKNSRVADSMRTVNFVTAICF